MIQYDVDVFKVEYSTPYKDQTVTASALVFIPKETDNVDVISLQHGTIASDSEAPTNAPLSDTQLLLYAALSGTGAIVAVPDFIGFGSSSAIMHPYYVEKPSADAVIDNIRAAGELAVQEDVILSGDLYLAGYSQGGYMTMAAHKSIEENGLEFFDLQASFPSSGGYDIPEVRDFFFEQEVYGQPFFLAYVAEAYRTYYDEDVDFLRLIFQEPYASEIPTYFDGNNSGGTINGFLTDTIANLVAPGYLSDTESMDFSSVNTKMQENSLLDWTPTIPVYMFHGDADITVPFRSSETTYDQFIENGASTNTITFTTLPGGTHFSGFGLYLFEFFDRISEMRGIATE